MYFHPLLQGATLMLHGWHLRCNPPRVSAPWAWRKVRLEISDGDRNVLTAGPRGRGLGVGRMPASGLVESTPNGS